MMKHTTHAVLLMSLLSGCADNALLQSDAESTNFEGDTVGDAFREALRLDVLPISAPSANGEAVLPQSFWLEATEDWGSQRLELAPTVTLSGTITGFAANPYGATPTVPGSASQPVEAQIELYQPDTIAAAVVLTDEDGDFTAQVPAGSGYRLVVRPLQAGSLPLLVLDNLTLEGDLIDLNALVEERIEGGLELSYADPVFGQITDDLGNPIGCTVRIIDALTGEESTSVSTNAGGYYYLRAEPGEHILEIIGDERQVIPTVKRQISFEEGTGGGQFDINLGELEPVFISGRVLSAAGTPLPDAKVRLTARDLERAAGSLVVEDETNSDGDFLARALPGEWTIEIIPNNESLSDSSPFEYDQAIGDDDLDLGALQLPPKVLFERQILGVSGEPAGGVVMTFYQQGFDGSTVSAQTDATGYFLVNLPDVPQTAYLTPTSNPDSAITRRELLSPSLDGSLKWSLADGAEISGSVRVAGTSGESGNYIIDARSADGVLLGSLLTTPNESSARFSLRIDLTE
ncbi:MAG: hypothetical protein ACI8S6_003561 [Myxococcota bacterium]